MRSQPPAAAGANGPHLFKKVTALCIGIDRYRSAAVDAIEGPEQDARELERVFREEYGYTTVSLLGPQATRSEIRSQLTRLSKELTDDDALIVYFAGHGQIVDLPSFGRAGYLIPYDADLAIRDTSSPTRWAEQALDMKNLAQDVEGCGARHVVFIVDTCFSGFMTRRGFQPAQGELAARRSRTVLAATTDRQASYRSGESGHGHFTGAMLKRLKGATRAVGLSDLFGSVQSM